MVQAKLDVTDQLGRRIVQIEKDPFAIGRRVTSDLHLPSGEVSRDHAEIASAGDGFEIRDRDSRYGTFVNGEEVKAHRLEHGDRVKLGRSGGASSCFSPRMLLSRMIAACRRTVRCARWPSCWRGCGP